MLKHFKSNPEEMSRMFNETIVQFPYDMILDRGYPTSLVYSKIYNRDTKDIDYISEIASKLKAKVFILTASDKDILARKKTDELIDNEKRIAINKEYKDFGRFMGWTVIDTSNLEPQYVCKEILKKLSPGQELAD
jgi:hypothetical protein